MNRFGEAMGDLPQRSLAQKQLFEAGHYAQAMSLPMSPSVAAELSLAYQLILETLHKGCGNEGHVTCMMHLTLKTLLVDESSGMKIKVEVFRDAQEGILRCRRSRRRTNTWDLDQAAYESLCQVVPTLVHDESIGMYDFNSVRRNSALREIADICGDDAIGQPLAHACR
jgi:hypothetical protein